VAEGEMREEMGNERWEMTSAADNTLSSFAMQ
jgi:hypothetical protein